VRLPVLLAFAACGWGLATAQKDDSLITVTLDTGPAYVVPEDVASAQKADLRENIPGAPKIEGFWTPSEVDVIVADRVFRELLQDAAKDPLQLFPDLAQKPDASAADNVEAAAQLQNERYELSLVLGHYDEYARQYVGIIIGGKKVIFCNYVVMPKVDPAARYLFTDKVFVEDGTVHFLQCRYDFEEKTCSNVSMIGSWQRAKD
jgi:hypothetical protein